MQRIFKDERCRNGPISPNPILRADVSSTHTDGTERIFLAEKLGSFDAVPLLAPANAPWPGRKNCLRQRRAVDVNRR